MTFDLGAYQPAARRSSRNVGKDSNSKLRRVSESFKELNEACHARDQAEHASRVQKRRRSSSVAVQEDEVGVKRTRVRAKGRAQPAPKQSRRGGKGKKTTAARSPEVTPTAVEDAIEAHHSLPTPVTQLAPSDAELSAGQTPHSLSEHMSKEEHFGSDDSELSELDESTAAVAQAAYALESSAGDQRASASTLRVGGEDLHLPSENAAAATAAKDNQVIVAEEIQKQHAQADDLLEPRTVDGTLGNHVPESGLEEALTTSEDIAASTATKGNQAVGSEDLQHVNVEQHVLANEALEPPTVDETPESSFDGAPATIDPALDTGMTNQSSSLDGSDPPNEQREALSNTSSANKESADQSETAKPPSGPELDRLVHDMTMDQIPMFSAAPSTLPQAIEPGRRKSGRAIIPPKLFQGLEKDLPTDKEIDLIEGEAEDAEDESAVPPKKKARRSSSIKKTIETTLATPFKKPNVSPPKTAPRRRAPTQRQTPNKIAASPSRIVKLPIANRTPTPPSAPTSLASIDATAIALSKALTSREALPNKPPPQGEPRVWADSRQALCETVPYFKKPQGGCHANDQHVYAFLFDGVGHCREYMDSDVIIARAGGGMAADSSGNMVQAKHQSMQEAQVLGMLNDVQLQNPLIVICGDRNTGALTKMPHKYNVLGWYKPVAVWAEKTAGKGKKNWTTIKYRLERLDCQQQAWFAPATLHHEQQQVNKAGQGKLLERDCEQCGRGFPQVYLESWLCLNPTCSRFWQMPSGQEASSGALTYNPAYLLHRTKWQCETEPFDVRPPLPETGMVIGDTLSYINTRGVCCPLCGRCNQRYKFSGWVCGNPDCKWEGLKVNHQPVPRAALHQPTDTFGDGPSLARNKHEPCVQVTIDYKYGYKITTYSVEGINGRFVHAAANNKINSEHQGPDDMFAALQTEDMGLERRRFGGGEKTPAGSAEKAIEPPETPPRTSADQNQLPTPPTEASKPVDPAEVKEAASLPAQVKPEVDSGDFMTAFSMNYGMPYKFVASGASKPFEQAPWPVRACRSRLNWAQRTFLHDRASDDDFNEELIFAYMEGQKIEYHDDGEEGLGPRIATLSLGGKAKMMLRMKTKHYVGCSKTGVFTADRPVPNGIDGPEMDRKRLSAWDELQALKEVDRAQYSKRSKEIPKELKLYEKKGKLAPDLVTVTLNHGDIVLMEGYDMQKYLEHKVVPESHLRFALTCRVVLGNHLKPEERPAYEVGPDDYGYDGSNLL